MRTNDFTIWMTSRGHRASAAGYSIVQFIRAEFASLTSRVSRLETSLKSQREDNRTRHYRDAEVVDKRLSGLTDQLSAKTKWGHRHPGVAWIKEHLLATLSKRVSLVAGRVTLCFGKLSEVHLLACSNKSRIEELEVKLKHAMEFTDRFDKELARAALEATTVKEPEGTPTIQRIEDEDENGEEQIYYELVLDTPQAEALSG